MIKQLILLIQVLGLFFYQLIFSGDLTVTQKLPDSINKGSEAIVEITIKKEDITGFAKVQQVFPEGFTAEPVDTKGATFSFKDNKVKFIWMALPQEKEFTISYKIKPNESTLGEFTLGGKFSFISDSERKNIEIQPAKFSVVEEAPIVETTTEETVAEETTEEEVVEETTEEEVTTKETVLDENTEDIVITTIKCDRVIENIEGGTYLVKLTIEKEGIQGFAKITEQLPEGFVAKESDSKGGVFSFKENEIKILWMAIPKDERFTISYTLEANEETSNGSYSIKGYFSYLENDVTSKYNIDGSNLELNREELIAEEVVADETDIEETVEETTTSEEETSEDVVEEETVMDTQDDLKKEVTSTPDPESNITYKVQVGAGHQKVSSNYFAVKFNLKDKVSTINHEGWIKYLVGSFEEYKSARDKRNQVRANVKTAFVTAYNSGTRITVQEALMISNQKWYK